MTPRVLVLSEDPVGERMGGNAIRASELARALGQAAEVTLAGPGGGSARLAGIGRTVEFDPHDPAVLRPLARAADVILSLPQSPAVTSILHGSGARVVYDLYDPRPLQVLEAFSGRSALTQRYWQTISLDQVLEALAHADFLICATERQRDLWIGALMAQRLISPRVYRADPSLRSLIDVVPFGVPSEPPSVRIPGPRERFPQIPSDGRIVLWNGGLWNWLDPVLAVEAINLVARARSEARLLFMGRPPGDPHQGAAARAARERADELGLLDSVVLFNDDWVPYAERAGWLLQADCALSLHAEHLETRYSFRTRLLDCLWAGLPIVCTDGDELAELVRSADLGAVTAPGDAAAVAAGLLGVLERGRDSFAGPLAAAAERYRWPVVARPLLEYVREDPPRNRRTPTITPPGRWTRARVARAIAAARRLRR